MTSSLSKSGRPTAFVLGGDALGGNLLGGLGDSFDVGLEVVAVDIDVAADVPGQRDAVEAVIRSVKESGSSRWILVGPSALAALVAARAMSGEAGVFGLAGVARLDRSPWPDALAAVPTVVVDAAPGAQAAAPGAQAAEAAQPTTHAAIASFWREHAGRGPVVPADFGRTIASPRTSSRTRSILARRALADDPGYAPRILTSTQLATFRNVADRTVPQDGDPIDLAARVDDQLAAGAGDGWRNAASPPDPEAYRLALDALEGFSELTTEAQDARLATIVDGTFEKGALSAAQLTAWFEDARVDLVRQWLAHPATMARIGFDGYSNGGDGRRIQGFQLLLPSQREGWEPAMEGLR